MGEDIFTRYSLRKTSENIWEKYKLDQESYKPDTLNLLGIFLKSKYNLHAIKTQNRNIQLDEL